MEPKRNFIRTLVVACTIIGVLCGGIWYTMTRIDTKFLSIQSARTEIQSKAQQYLPQIDRKLTSKEQLLAFSTDINFLAEQAGFNGSPRFKEETGPQSGDLRKTSFELSLEGSHTLNDLAQFFTLVERSNYFVKFASLDIIRGENALRAVMSGYVISF
ncbi:MAG: hypothetical protein UY00_C0005G0011 [Candidatus Wolfebacteria bacterium GW2011_GWA1_47_6]|nr:MAG: hypothetical protein UY00_C0005G0011 [Candidatus Wolfebacteria bacterium GW2011_GWA1_47_6]